MNKFLNTKELASQGKRALDTLCKYYNNIDSVNVFPKIEPGYLRQQFPAQAPLKGSSPDEIYKDIEEKIIPSAAHWQHPNFYAYFPSLVCHTTIVAEMLAVGLNTPGFTWAASPVATELENIVVDWVVQMMGLPEKFLLKNSGGGMIGPTIGDDIFFSIHAAKYKKMKETGMEYTDPRLLKLAGYYTGISHSQNLKGLFIKDVPYRREIPMYFDKTTESYQIKPEEFEKMVKDDVKNGLIPFWCGSTIGATSMGSSDPLEEIGKICKEHNIWMNVDGAWAGNALVIPEISNLYRKGLEYCDSISINFSKWMMCGMTSALFYVADKKIYNESMAGKGFAYQIPSEYLKNKYTEEHDVTDYKDWQIGLGRRFSSLKIWYMLKNYGVEGVRQNITEKIDLAKEFEAMVRSDDRFELICKRELSLVCYRLVKDSKGNRIPEDKINDVNRKLLAGINETNKFYLVGSEVNGLYFLRTVICSHFTTSEHLKTLWAQIDESSKQVA